MPARRPGVYGVTLWAPSLFVLLLQKTPQEAAQMMILLTVMGFLGRLSFSYLSDQDRTDARRAA